MNRDSRWCLICNPKNRTLYWHKDSETGDIWCYCNKCDKGRSLRSYCYEAGLSLNEFLKMDFFFEEAKPNEVSRIDWPSNFINLADPRADEGVSYIKERGLSLDGDMYYDLSRKGIVFPYYFGNYFCGAQTRFLKPYLDLEGNEHKIDTLPGTRLGLLFYGWNQDKFMGNVRYLVVVEGAFNALSINQAFAAYYGGSIVASPWRAVALSGAGASKHQIETLKDLKKEGLFIVSAPDRDEAGIKMFKKMLRYDSISHTAFPVDENKDWNDYLKDMGPIDFAKWFLDRIKKI